MLQPCESVSQEALLAQGWKARDLPGHMGQIGPLWARKTAEGQWEYGLLAGPQHLNPAGVVHGGALLSLADHAISTVAWEASGRQPCVTLQLDSHFVAPVHAGQLVQVSPTLMQRSPGMVFVRAELMVQAQLVLSAQAIMKVLRSA